MSQKCEILDDDEIEKQEKIPFNFRRFDVEELERRSSPFEKTKKKEFPFLFQKKKPRILEEKKISLDELMMKVNNLNLTENKIVEEYESLTPPYPPCMVDGLNNTIEEEKEKEKQEDTNGKK